MSQAGKRPESLDSSKPIGSMYGIFTYILVIFMVNVGEYIIHGSYGKEYSWNRNFLKFLIFWVHSCFPKDRQYVK